MLSACVFKQEINLQTITYQNIEKHIAELASDKYLGRQPIDFKDKTIIVFVNDPGYGATESYFKGNTDVILFLGKFKKRIEYYWKNTYYKPSDEYVAGRDDVSGLVDDANLLNKVGFNLANSTEWPAWNNDSEFKLIREKSILK